MRMLGHHPYDHLKNTHKTVNMYIFVLINIRCRSKENLSTKCLENINVVFDKGRVVLVGGD